MDNTLTQNLWRYTARRRLTLSERLGFGIHGVVFVVEDKSKGGKTAVKVHRSTEPFQRECEAYERLRAARVSKILGMNVPQLVNVDVDLKILEMTVVTRPFVLDFAGAVCDVPPDFSEEIWGEWEKEKREQFGDHWANVQAVLANLEVLGIHMIDVSPSNIAFLAD